MSSSSGVVPSPSPSSSSASTARTPPTSHRGVAQQPSPAQPAVAPPTIKAVADSPGPAKSPASAATSSSSLSSAASGVSSPPPPRRHRHRHHHHAHARHSKSRHHHSESSSEGADSSSSGGSDGDGDEDRPGAPAHLENAISRRGEHDHDHDGHGDIDTDSEDDDDDDDAVGAVLPAEQIYKPRPTVVDLDSVTKKTHWYKDGNSRRVVAMAVLTLLFCIGEVAVAVITGSLALLADGFHMLSDEISLIIGFIALRLAEKQASRKMSYGWRRAEVIGGIVNGVFLLSVAIFIFLEAISRFIEIPTVKSGLLIVIVGGAGLLLNVIGLIIFAGHAHIGHNHDHGHGHSHEHGHSHKHKHKHEDHGDEHGEHDHDHDIEMQSTSDKGKKPPKKEKKVNLNLHGVFLHVLGDALGSIAATGVGLCIWLIDDSKTWKYYLDPAASVLVSFIILKSSIPLIMRCIKILMQMVPESVDLKKLTEDLKKVPGALDIHDLHIWELTSQDHVGTLHITVSKEGDFMTLARELQRVLHTHNIHATTIQPEYPDSGSSEDPQDCMLMCDYKKKNLEKCSLIQRTTNNS